MLAMTIKLTQSYRRKQDNLGKHLSEFEKKKLLEEQERQYYYVNYLGEMEIEQSLVLCRALWRSYTWVLK